MNELPQLVETSGASGTTKHLVAYLQQLTDTEMAAGNLTEQEASQFTALANKGHKLARFRTDGNDGAGQ